MELIYSKAQPELLLHIIFRKKDFVHGRKDIISPTQFLQCSALKLKKRTTFRPHKHFERERKYSHYRPQESWVVIRGKVRCILYDTDDTVLAKPVLHPGDASFTLNGGHNYFILKNHTMVYEMKSGPYYSQTDDKIFI